MRTIVWIPVVLSLLAAQSCVQDKSVDYRAVPDSGRTASRPSGKPIPKPSADPATASSARVKPMSDEEIPKTAEGWRKILTADQFSVLRDHGTEQAFTGKYWNNKKSGVYVCAGCGEHVFHSATKFESGTGWPSFFKPASEKAVETNLDESLGMLRNEVHCKRCGGHLGHVFDDGPQPTGQRYCINSVSLKFQEGTDAKK